MFDIYNEEKTQTQVLNSKPTSFVIFGKPGCGKTTLAKGLAKLWHCQYIGGSELISRAIVAQTENGIKAQELLFEGGSISDDLVIAMLEEELKSKRVEHHGYILDDIPTISEDYLSISDQLEFLRRLPNKPDFIINIRIPDNDLISRRKGFRIDPRTNQIYRREFYDEEFIDTKTERRRSDDEEEEDEDEEEEDAFKDEEEGENNEDEDVFDEDMETIATPAVIDRLIARTEDLEEKINEDIRSYRALILRQVEDFMGDHDSRLLIELDGNLPPKDLLKDLITRLSDVLLRRSYVPVRLQGGNDQEEIPEDTDTDDMLRSLATMEMLAPGFRWRRSRWGRICPVSLAEGNLVQGSPQYAVSFLDKMYVLSTAENLEKFLQCPRQYLQAPQPRHPCKFCVLGPPLSGKTSLCKRLAEHFSAKVFDMAAMMEKPLQDKREALIEEVRKEALENAIHRTLSLIEQEKEKKERLAREKAEEEAKENEETATALRQTEGDGQRNTVIEEEDGNAEGEEGEDGEKEENEEKGEEEEEVVVDENHPNVKKLVDEAVAEATTRDLNPTPDVFVDVLETAILDWYKELQADTSDLRIAGNWILDNFPVNRDQFTAMMERGIIPDDIIYLRDGSDDHQVLMARWKSQNEPAPEVDQKNKEKDPENKDPAAETDEANASEMDTPRDAGFEDAAKDEKTTESETDDPESGPKATEEGEEEATPEGTPEKGSSPTNEANDEAPSSPGGKAPDEPIVISPEAAFSKSVQEYEKNWLALHAIARNPSGIEPIVLECNGEEDAILKMTIKKTDLYNYKGWEYSGMDQDEEEEDLADEEEAEEELPEEDPLKSDPKKPFGDLRHFCPIQLKDRHVLWPGTSESAVKYKEKVYFCSTRDARDTFLENPNQYLGSDEPLKPPAPRILLLGPKGSGKTTVGRKIAKKFGLFHISFKDLLQERILTKMKKRIGPDYPEEDMNLEERERQMELEKQQEEEEEALSETKETAPLEHADSQQTIISVPTAPAEEAVQESEKEPEIELSELEENIRDTLLETHAPTNSTLETLVPCFWEQEPYKSVGFLLEGFPYRAEEVGFLVDNGLFPDCAVFLGVEDQDIVDRLMPDVMDKWRRNRKIQIAKKERALRLKKKKRDKERAKRIEARRKEIEERKLEKLREKELRQLDDEDYDEEEEEEEEEEEDDEEAIGAIVDAEMDEEYEDDDDEEEDEETEEDATERIQAEITDRYEENVNALSNVRDALEEFGIPRVEVEAVRKPHVVQFMIEKALRPVLENRNSLLEICQPIPAPLARRLLMQGYKMPSQYGRWCPIKLLESDILPPSESAQRPLFPLVHRQYIYFCSSQSAQEQFISNPWKYRSIEPPLPTVPIRLAIIGPPKSGKTTLSKRFVQEYGIVRLSIGEAMRKVLTLQETTELGQQLQEHLKAGLTVPDELAVQALEVATLSVQCQTRGYVLDGYPMTEHQVRLLTAKAIIPYVTIELQVGDHALFKRGAEDRISNTRIYPLHDSHKILTIKMANYYREIPFVKNWYQEQHRNLFAIEGERSKWWVFDKAVKQTKNVVNKIREYVYRSNKGLASRIRDLCITPAEVKDRLGDFSYYCPVSYVERGELVDCSEHATLEYAAEYAGRYYRMASENELQLFLETPEKYVPPPVDKSLPSPEFLPKKCNADSIQGPFPGQLELQGYCAVTYMDGDFRYEALKLGEAAFLVEYREKLYACCSEETRDKFMRLPEKYCHLLLPRKLPPRADPVPIHSLPMIGFMEQSVGVAITKAMTAAGCFKPKYPFLTARQSALLYVAYHLKAYNPKSSEYVRKKYKKKLQQFEEKCQLIRYLGGVMTYKYCEPEDRPRDFDHKLLSFMSMKGTPPPAKWLT